MSSPRISSHTVVEIQPGGSRGARLPRFTTGDHQIHFIVDLSAHLSLYLIYTGLYLRWTQHYQMIYLDLDGYLGESVVYNHLEHIELSILPSLGFDYSLLFIDL